MRLEDKQFGKTIKQHIREFGQVMTLVAVIATFYFAFKKNDIHSAIVALVIGLFCHEVAYYYPKLVYPVWNLWMKLAHAIGAVMTTFILGVAWFVILVPVSLTLKVLGKKVMQLGIDKSAKTYWNDRPEKYFDFKRMENQF